MFCQALAEVHQPDSDEAKIRAAGLRSVRITPVGDLARLDAMLDPALAARLKTILAATARAAPRADPGRSTETIDVPHDSYQHAIWGWAGQHPQPPPGHPPP